MCAGGGTCTALVERRCEVDRKRRTKKGLRKREKEGEGEQVGIRRAYIRPTRRKRERERESTGGSQKLIRAAGDEFLPGPCAAAPTLFLPDILGYFLPVFMVNRMLMKR